MKKIFVSFFLIFALLPATSFAWDNKSTDAVTGKTEKCNKKDAGKLHFCTFPEIRQCRKKSFLNHQWDSCYQSVCSGYNHSEYRSESMEPVHVTSGNSKCWKWKCKSGYVSFNGSCITPDQCRAQGNYKASETECVADSWCSADLRSTYDSSIHEQVKVGGCDSYKCKIGYCSTTDVASPKCSEASPENTFGGTYRNTQGLCQTCDTDSYVNSTQSGCIKGTSVGKTTMKSCFDCTELSKFADCVKNGGSASAAGCPAGDKTVVDSK